MSRAPWNYSYLGMNVSCAHPQSDEEVVARAEVMIIDTITAKKTSNGVSLKFVRQICFWHAEASGVVAEVRNLIYPAKDIPYFVWERTEVSILL